MTVGKKYEANFVYMNTHLVAFNDVLVFPVVTTISKPPVSPSAFIFRGGNYLSSVWRIFPFPFSLTFDLML